MTPTRLHLLLYQASVKFFSGSFFFFFLPYLEPDGAEWEWTGVG